MNIFDGKFLVRCLIEAGGNSAHTFGKARRPSDLSILLKLDHFSTKFSGTNGSTHAASATSDNHDIASLCALRVMLDGARRFRRIGRNIARAAQRCAWCTADSSESGHTTGSYGDILEEIAT